MSLFDDSPTVDPAEQQSHSQTRKSYGALFNDDEERDTGQAEVTASLFGQESEAEGHLWGASNKKSTHVERFGNFLSTAPIPKEYLQAYEVIVSAGSGPPDEGLSQNEAKDLIDAAIQDVSARDTITKIIRIGRRANANYDRNEFYVIWALIALAQGRQEISLDCVDERRKNLPIPVVPAIDKQYQTRGKISRHQNPVHESASSTQSGTLPALEPDPWATDRAVLNDDAAPVPSSLTKSTSQPEKTARTTSTFTTKSGSFDSAETNLDLTQNKPSVEPTSWSYPGGVTSGISAGESLQTAHIGQDIYQNVTAYSANKTKVSRPSASSDIVTITLMPDKQGVFLFQHHNYEVKCARKGSSVVRRYSDFIWLLESLHRRYPFRQLPLLPPKRVSVNGNHLSSDVTFIEKRRKGLVRFVNALIRHPVIGQDQLVTMFLTVPTELAVWRKQATANVHEEFVNRSLPAGLEESLPTSVDEMFDRIYKGVKDSANEFINLCNLVERLSKRNIGVASDSQRIASTLSSLSQATEATYAMDTNDVPLLNAGILAVSKHLGQDRGLLQEQAASWNEGFLEDLKQQRDALVCLRDMFDRKDRLAKDNIPHLRRKIDQNETKISALINGTGGKPGEIEKLTEAVQSDKQSIIDQHTRNILIRECIRDELNHFQSSAYHVSHMFQDWSRERVRYAELQTENWRRLAEEVEHMPVEE